MRAGLPKLIINIPCWIRSPRRSKPILPPPWPLFNHLSLCALSPLPAFTSDFSPEDYPPVSAHLHRAFLPFLWWRLKTLTCAFCSTRCFRPWYVGLRSSVVPVTSVRPALSLVKVGPSRPCIMPNPRWKSTYLCKPVNQLSCRGIFHQKTLQTA